MNVLFLTRDVPYPPHNGYKKRNFYFIKALADRGIDVVLVTRKETVDTKFSKMCRHIELVDSKVNVVGALLKSLGFWLPFTVLKRTDKNIKAVIEECISQFDIDVVICDSMYQSMNIPVIDGVTTVLYEHNIESVIIQRYAQKEPNIFKKFFALIEHNKMRFLQKRMWKRFDLCIACSEKEKKEMAQFAKKVFVVNNGVDREYFCSTGYAQEDHMIIYTGQIGWFPNEDAVLYFVERVYPFIKGAIPDVRFWVIGNKPSERVKNLTQQDKSITVAGFVEDIRPYMGKAQVFVVPLRIGSGTRLKILEALSMKKAVVSTSVGCEGLDVQNGIHLLVENEPRRFAEAVIKLMNNPEMNASLGDNGRRLVEERYDWKAVFSGLDDILDALDVSRNA